MPDRLIFPEGSEALADFTMRQVLDGVTYTLRFIFDDERASRWSLRVLAADGATVLIGDTRVVCNFPIAAYAGRSGPPGSLVFVDSSGADEDPGFGDLGRRVVALYYAEAELG